MTLVDESRASPFSMDHDVLLTLLNGTGVREGLGPADILHNESLPPPTAARLRGMQNPYPSLTRILTRMEARGVCLRRGDRWRAIEPGRVVEGGKIARYEGATKVLRYFLLCRDLNCERDHLPEFILSDYAFQLVPKLAMGPPIFRLVAKAIVWEAGRSSDLSADFKAWQSDMLRNATRRGVKKRNFPKFEQHVRSALPELERMLREGTLEERVDRVGKWLLADPRRIYLFFSSVDAKNLIRWAMAASPTFWRYAFTGAPLKESDFAPIHARTPEVETMRLTGLTVKNGPDMTFAKKVKVAALSLITIWLKHDLEHFARTAARLRALDARIKIQQGFGKDSGITFKVEQRRKV